MFRAGQDGRRTPDANLCVHSQAALAVASENAVAYAEVLRPTTGRYYFWVDDARPMCRCTRCRELCDSDQALILENHLLGALRAVDDRASLAHLAYMNTLPPPAQVRPESGVFLEFAPIRRRHEVPFSRRDARLDIPGSPSHAEQLDLLDANLALFGSRTAQALEYWLDVSRFARWRRERMARLPWNRAVLADDLRTYSSRGVRNITSFAVWIDGDYVRRFGEPPLREYGDELAKLPK